MKARAGAKNGAGPALDVGVVGVGWIGGLRAQVLSNSGLVARLFLAEIDEARGSAVAAEVGAAGMTADYHQWLEEVDAVIVATTPESSHFPIAKECLEAGKHVFLEKPIALTLEEADVLNQLADSGHLTLSIGFTQRFNPKMAWVKSAVSAGEIGRPISAMVSRNMSRAIGHKVSSRGRLGPALMQAPHDVDLELWWFGDDRPERVYAQSSHGMLYETFGIPDCTWILGTMRSGSTFVVGANWSLPGEATGAQSTVVECMGTDGGILVDDSRRDVMLVSGQTGLRRPLATMPGESLDHVFAGPLESETLAFIHAVLGRTGAAASGHDARRVLEVCLAAERSAQSGLPERV